MTQPLPTHELIERLRAGLSSDGRKVQNGLDVSTSLRVPGALSGPLAGVSFIAGVAGALALSESPYPRQSTSKGRDPSPGPRPSSRRAMLVPLVGGAAIPLPLEKRLRGTASPKQGQRYDASHHQRQSSGHRY
jgi:hypothetical protein